MAYKFKGYSWHELAEVWGITLTPESLNAKVVDENGEDTGEVIDMGMTPERIDRVLYINGMKMSFQLDDEEEVLAEKVKQHIDENVDSRTGDFKNPQMRRDLVAFLTKLADEEDKTGYNAPVFRAIAAIEGDSTMAKWVSENLEELWS
jgi:hypothetical protein